MSQDQSREDRAFEGLMAETFRKLGVEELCINQVREPNETEEAALELLGKDFVDRLISGTLSPRKVKGDDDAGELAMAGEASGEALFRCDGVEEDVAEELLKADQEIIERKKRERYGETS